MKSRSAVNSESLIAIVAPSYKKSLECHSLMVSVVFCGLCVVSGTILLCLLFLMFTSRIVLAHELFVVPTGHVAYLSANRR